MNVWIYDENSYPSGFAGGFVPDAMPESRGMGLAIERAGMRRQARTRTSSRCSGRRATAMRTSPSRRKAGEIALPEGKYLVASLRWAGTSALVRRQVLRQPPDAGRDGEVPGRSRWTRTPATSASSSASACRASSPTSRTSRPAGGLPWANDLPEVFQKRWGYDLIDSLPSLVRPVGDWKRVRHNYLQILLDLFIERWAKPYYEYCDKHGLEFTGHYWEHEWPNCLDVAGQHGDVRLAPAARDRHPDEPVRRGRARPVRQHPRRSRSFPAWPISSAASEPCARPTAPAAGTCGSRT